MSSQAKLKSPALVLAGGKPSPEFAQLGGVPVASGARALVEINGQPMVSYVLRALQQAELVDQVILVAPSGFPDLPDADIRVEADGDIAENIRSGLRHCGEAEAAFIATADIPFLTPEAVDAYIRASREANVDLCYSGIPKAACEQRFPNMKRTYFHGADQTVTGGNVVYQRLSAFEREMAVLREAYLRRKNPLFLARLIGLGNLVKFATRRLTLADIEKSASRIMGVRCRIVVTSYAELGADVDKPEDLILARTWLKPE